MFFWAAQSESPTGLGLHPPFAGCGTLGKFLHLSEPQFPCVNWQRGDQTVKCVCKAPCAACDTWWDMLQIWCLFLICLHFLLLPCPRTWASASISFLTMAGKKGGVSLGFSGKILPELTLEYCTPPLQSTGEGAKG